MSHSFSPKPRKAREGCLREEGVAEAGEEGVSVDGRGDVGGDGSFHVYNRLGALSPVSRSTPSIRGNNAPSCCLVLPVQGQRRPRYGAPLPVSSPIDPFSLFPFDHPLPGISPRQPTSIRRNQQICLLKQHTMKLLLCPRSDSIRC
ncbi:unnamed protein product [Linum trigynum]|uniref:Uncharacterized protein n=1 Tax=Linum trigynum TaxID=586398 RepID=A0AAV2FSU3_9ROSI